MTASANRRPVDVRVVTDSASDLPDEMAAQLGIAVVPLTIRFGDTELVDREQLSGAEFWERVRGSDTVPSTAAPSAGRFESEFRRLAGEGATDVVCITISSRLSATLQSAQIAARAVADECRVEVFDSLAVSMAQGNLCLDAVARASGGVGLPEVLADLAERRQRTRVAGTVETLEFLRRGGRIGNAAALLGGVLSMKPILELRDGRVEAAGKVRTRARALRELAARLVREPVERVVVCHADAGDVGELLELLAPVAPPDGITVSVLGPVIGAHAGPGAVVVCYQAGQER